MIVFTLIICTKNRIKDIKETYRSYFSALFDFTKFDFCEWNPEGQTVSEALPDLKKIISGKKQWRVIAVLDDDVWGSEQINNFNPFDFVKSQKFTQSFETAEEIINHRKYIDESTFKALSNPLTRLGIWLFGAPINVVDSMKYLEGLENIQPGSQEYYNKLEALSVSPRKAEMDYGLKFRYEKIVQTFGTERELFYSPSSFIALSERSLSAEKYRFNNMWKRHGEFEYSEFGFDNLYSNSLKFLTFDLPRLKDKREKSKYLNFLLMILILANNEESGGMLRQDRLYTVNIEIDVERLKSSVNHYIGRLMATIVAIDKRYNNLDIKSKAVVDSETVHTEFESDVEVPIDVYSDTQKGEFFVEHNKIGLSSDCPIVDYDYWEGQYNSIFRKFVRFLREPRRAVKKATKINFRKMNKIEDDRVLQLNEYQREDIQCVLDENEQQMIKTKTPMLFNTISYTEKLQQADKEVKRGISQRMTKKKTILVGLFAVIAYLIGFLPLIFSNLNTTKSILFSLTVTGIVIALFLMIGFIYLFVLRHRIINRFKHFNYVMSGILNDIDEGLNAFSHYLSHTCNVMREFSVLNHSHSKIKNKQYVLLNHKRIIQNKIQETYDIFSVLLDADDIKPSPDESAFEYDFTVMDDYIYEMNNEYTKKRINFLQEGNQITIPIDYIESITLTREELYD